MARSTLWRCGCWLLALLGLFLGFWQTARGVAKHHNQSVWQRPFPDSVASLSPTLWQDPPERGTPFCAEGRYGPHHFVWNNLSIEGQRAMRLYSTLIMNEETGLIVSRGWQHQPPQFPEHIPQPQGRLIVCGHLTPPTRMPLIQSSLVPHQGAHPEIHEVISVIPEEWSQITGLNMPDWVLHLDEHEPGALLIVSFGGERMTPGRHGAYALQWFALAVVAVFFACRRHPTTS